MKHITIFAAVGICFGFTGEATAAEMTLVRNSRPVSTAEVAGGAPSGGMVHEFYATSDADLLSLGTPLNQWVYQHPYGSDNDAPESELIAYFPALAADSFLRMPSSTIMLGGGFNGASSEKAWGDLNDDGPQTNFLFGRLTTVEPGSFAGDFYLRGVETYIKLPFSFTLPDPLGLLTESIFISGVEERQTPSTSPEPSQISKEETAAPKPRHLESSRSEQLKAWTFSLSPPSLPLPPTSETLTSVLAFKESRQQNLPRTMLIAETVTSIPEPASWILASIALRLLIHRRTA